MADNTIPIDNEDQEAIKIQQPEDISEDWGDWVPPKDVNWHYVALEPPYQDTIRKLRFHILGDGPEVVESAILTTPDEYTLYKSPDGSTPWNNDLLDNCETNCVIVDGYVFGDIRLGLVSKIQDVGDGSGWVWFKNCSFQGLNKDSIAMAATGDWEAGIFCTNCSFSNMKCALLGAKAMENCSGFNLGSEFLHHVLAAYNLFCNGIEKPEGSSAHPDAIQHSWTVDPEVIIMKNITVLNAKAQGIFFRSTCEVSHVCLDSINIACTEDNGYVSQIMGVFKTFFMKDITLTNQYMTLRNDSTVGADATDIEQGRFININADFRVDPTIPIGEPVYGHPA